MYLSSVFDLTSNFEFEWLRQNRIRFQFSIRQNFETIRKLDRTSFLDVEWRFYDLEIRLNDL